MQLTVPLVNFLRSDTVSATLLDLAAQDVSDTQTLPLLSQLRRQYTPEEAGILLSQARLRHKAVDKFGDSATQMLFTEHALQQASNPRIRQYRATKLDTSYPVFDMGCGIGADSLAMAVA
ncbi:MAG: SAM-dependent methyltransferase, partial [Aggregatilineales bacterium]